MRPTSQTSCTSALAVLLAAGLVGSIEFGPIRAQSAPELQKADPPAHAVWVDSLDLSKASIRRPRAGRGGRGATPPSGPPPLKFVLGGVEYPHAVPLNADSDLVIDLRGQATRFQSMVGVDDSAGSGRGSVGFGVWVDGRKVADTGVMRGGDAAKLLSVDLAGARRLVLAVNDGNDGTANDFADWAGGLITMTATATQRPEVAAWPSETAPAIASSHSPEPMLNYPQITGATPGRPFMFLIPASGDGPLAFAAKNLPPGVTRDPTSGLISGALQTNGRTVVDVTITGPKGKANGQITLVGGEHMLALTPPLGWNSWNAWGGTVTADKVRASADGLVEERPCASGLHVHQY